MVRSRDPRHIRLCTTLCAASRTMGRLILRDGRYAMVVLRESACARALLRMRRISSRHLSSALGLMLNLQWLAGLDQLPFLEVLLDPFRALRQRGLVKQRQERREPLAVDQPEDLDIALRRRAPLRNVERALRLGEKPVVADVRAAAL